MNYYNPFNYYLPLTNTNPNLLVRNPDRPKLNAWFQNVYRLKQLEFLRFARIFVNNFLSQLLNDFIDFQNNPAFGEFIYLSYYYTMLAVMIQNLITIGQRPFNNEDQNRIIDLCVSISDFILRNQRIVGILFERLQG